MGDLGRWFGGSMTVLAIGLGGALVSLLAAIGSPYGSNSPDPEGRWFSGFSIVAGVGAAGLVGTLLVAGWRMLFR